ncbi:hypothetical protein SUGI_0874130 [Cryptomeria japonica]|nr:hypothetical protein SUGI_0874130 [Cryptomeria japonica]
MSTVLPKDSVSAHDMESQRFAGWIRNLRSLEYMNMNWVNLSMASEDWGNSLSSLSNLREIRLSECGL